MTINKEDWTDIKGDQLLEILDALKIIREKLSTRTWNELPIRYSSGSKNIQFELIITNR